MKHSHTLNLDIASTEIAVDVTFTCSPYIPEQGPSYSSGGQPAEGGELEIESGTITIGKAQHPAPDWLLNIISEDDDSIEKLRESAREDDGDDCDARYDASRDERDAA